MLNLETQAHIRHLFYAEHWTIGTIAQQLGVHHDAVRHALQTDSFHREQALRPCITDPYVEFVRETLKNYPQLRATRIFQMLRDRGYTGSVVQLRRVVARWRPEIGRASCRERVEVEGGGGGGAERWLRGDVE